VGDFSPGHAVLQRVLRVNPAARIIVPLPVIEIAVAWLDRRARLTGR